MPGRLMTRREVAIRLGVSVDRLARKHYDGPRFIKLGHRTVRYRESDVLDWEKQKLTNQFASV